MTLAIARSRVTGCEDGRRRRVRRHHQVTPRAERRERRQRQQQGVEPVTTGIPAIRVKPSDLRTFIAARVTPASTSCAAPARLTGRIPQRAVAYVRYPVAFRASCPLARWGEARLLRRIQRLVASPRLLYRSGVILATNFCNVYLRRRQLQAHIL